MKLTLRIPPRAPRCKYNGSSGAIFSVSRAVIPLANIACASEMEVQKLRYRRGGPSGREVNKRSKKRKKSQREAIKQRKYRWLEKSEKEGEYVSARECVCVCVCG